jgi:phage terminase large subunit
LKLAKTYYDVRNCKTRIQVHQGGTRSGKTYSILLSLVEFCYRNPNGGAVLTICRKTFPALRASVMRDFFDILKREGIYTEVNHNKSDATYILEGNLIEFISIDQPQKIRGRKRDVLFINEANELNLEDFRQLLIRTTGKVLLDYNPSDEFHWIYDHVIPREDATFFQSTFRDNPFLEPSLVTEIERLQVADPNYWRIYGLGERGQSRSTILTHWSQTETIDPRFKLVAYGLDFGYTNDPTACVAVYSDGEAFLLDEVLYQNGLSNRQIFQLLESEVGKNTVIADSAEPKSIDELHGYGMNVHPARKGPDSVRAGIQFFHSKPLAVTSRSLNLIKELRNYKWKEDKNGKNLNEPVDAFNHAIDAARYAAMFNQSNPNYGRYRIG